MPRSPVSAVAGAVAALVLTAGCASVPPPSADSAAAVETPPATSVGANHAATSAGQASSAAPTSSTDSATPTAGQLPEVPSLWRDWPTDRPLFPELRLVGFSGYPGAPGQGKLGVGNLDARVTEIVKVGKDYTAGDRRVIPTLELIAVTVQGAAGRDGKYRSRTTHEVIRKHVTAARKVGGIVLLNVQPGRSDFLTEAKALEQWLVQPDVGLALDPEWRMGPGEVPMRVFGHVTGKELNSVAAWLSGLAAQHRLPPRIMLYHQLNAKIVRGQQDIKAHPGVEIVKAVDGIGSRGMKLETWKKLTTGLPPHIRAGFKLFYQEDREFGPLMTPAQVLAMKPTVDYVLYE